VIGYGIAHVSYARLKLDDGWAWEHRHIAHAIAERLDVFARTAPNDRLDPGWPDRLRAVVAPISMYLPRDSRPVGTPMIAHYRNPPAPT
jgi:hypothetical protein